MALTPLTEPLGFNRASHLLRRTVFGATVALVNEFAALTPQQAIQRLFMDELPDPELPIDPATATEWIESGTTDANSEGFELESYFLRWQLGLYLAPKVPEEQKLAFILRERLVFFLHTHFTTKKSVVGNSRALYFQNALFRKFAFDSYLQDELNFKSLCKKITVDNAMLRFLDGRLNVKGNPNENYAREFLELYTIGRGLEGADKDSQGEGDYGTFTEQDVQEGARVMSGFDIDNTFSNIDSDTELPTGSVKGNGQTANQHDNDPKTLSYRFGEATITPDPDLLLNGNATPESALDEIQQLVDIIFDQTETGLHIARKLYRFFGYHEINESVQAGIITDLATVFRDNDFRIQPVLEAFFTSREFYEGAAGVTDDSYGSIIKSPIDLVIGQARSFELELPDYIDEYEAFYEASGTLLSRIDDMGLAFYEPYEVAGYSAYHQFPIYHRSWITTTYLTQRYAFVQYLNFNMMNDLQLNMLSPIEYVEKFIDDSIASNARLLVEEVCRHFLPLSNSISFEDNSSELTNERLLYFLDAFLNTFAIDENPEEAWNFRWTNNVDRETVSRQLLDLFNGVLQSPEYQLM